ncbi:uncharacterized protein LOC110244172 isoform X2 [Exaiptasia diaphana]|uniref:Mid2 domain-containing protein n=1 Tax=Exaiptasia diaphana TaxID=2652724 RepID=A0A913XLG5_EXADI|nr:uncharacterized protein LOC110244172 isoform X2 [Exaiptasia diaphana]
MFGIVAFTVFIYKLEVLCNTTSVVTPSPWLSPTRNYPEQSKLPSSSQSASYIITSSHVKSTLSHAIVSTSVVRSVQRSITVNTTKITSLRSTTTPSPQSKIAMYAGIGGGIGALAVIAIVIMTYGWFSKRKLTRNRVDIHSSDHGSDPPSWRHSNVKHPLSSRITERTENSSSQKHDM